MNLIFHVFFLFGMLTAFLWLKIKWGEYSGSSSRGHLLVLWFFVFHFLFCQIQKPSCFDNQVALTMSNDWIVSDVLLQGRLSLLEWRYLTFLSNCDQQIVALKVIKTGLLNKLTAFMTDINMEGLPAGSYYTNPRYFLTVLDRLVECRKLARGYAWEFSLCLFPYAPVL